MESKAEEWTCARCGTLVPSPHDGDPPSLCLESVGGCNRDSDDTFFYPGKWSAEKMALYQEAEFGTEGRILFKRIVTELERLIVFQHPWHSRALALWVFQTYLKDIMPVVFYIGIVGTKGTAKTTVLEIIREYAKNGVIMGVGSSIAGIARSAGRGDTICIDEFDEITGDIGKTLQGICRQGYRADSATIRKWDIKTNSALDINPFGPKAITFRGDIDDALATRTFPIAMAEVVPSDEMVDRIGDLIIRDEKNLRNAISDFCKSRYIGNDAWSLDKVKTLIGNHNFRERVKRIAKRAKSNRQIEQIYMWTALSDIIGIDLEEEINNVLKFQAEGDDEGISELKEFIRTYWESHSKPGKVGLTELRVWINNERKESQDRPISEKSWRKLLRNVGARDGYELRRVTGGKPGLFFTPEYVHSLYEEPSLAPEVSSLFKYDTQSEPSLSDDIVVNVVMVQDEKVKVLKTISDELLAESDGIDLSKVKVRFTPKDDDFVDKQFKRWLEEGVVYEPKLGSGVYKFA